MRIGSMIKQLLEEVRNAPLDEAGRRRLADVHHRSIEELKDGLAPELVAELDRIALPFRDDSPTDAELRIAQAQLVGWLEGLFHGIQTALVAQQMAAQQQLQQMRALPPGPGASYGTPPGMQPGGAPARRAGPHGPVPLSVPGGPQDRWASRAGRYAAGQPQSQLDRSRSVGTTRGVPLRERALELVAEVLLPQQDHGLARSRGCRATRSSRRSSGTTACRRAASSGRASR